MRSRWVLAGCVTTGAAVLLALAAAQAATAGQTSYLVPQRTGPAPIGPVLLKPATTTPHLPSSASPAQQVRQLVRCKGTMFAVGTFATIEQGSKTYPRENAMSFSATSPYAVTAWAPQINGEVDSIAFNGGNCADAYIGGSFTKVNGTTVQNIAEISTSTGAVIKAFGHTANKTVDTLLGVGGHILAGGDFTIINGSNTDPHMASLNPKTGADDGYLHLKISGSYSYPNVDGNSTKVYNQALSYSGKLDLVMGDFTSVGGLSRQQIFMLSLGKNKGTVTAWTSPEFDGSDGNLPSGYPYQCAVDEPFYIRAAAWAPNDQKIYLAATGYHPWNVPITDPRSGLCDSASAFPATEKSVLHLWVNYTGCDSLYAAAADMSTAYFAGHERFSENPDGCDAPGPGAIDAPGIEGLSPANGTLTFNPTRARGLGADDMLLTSAGLWIANDDFDDSQACGGVNNLAGICFLPY